MQTIVTYDWSGNVGDEVVGSTSRIADNLTGLPVSKVYAKQIRHLFNYGMNACDDRAVVKHCIVQCFLYIRPELLLEVEAVVVTNIFKIFRRLLIQQKGINLFPAAEIMRGLTSLQREALLLKFQFGLAYPDVADVMHLPIEQLRGEIFKAVAILSRDK